MSSRRLKSWKSIVLSLVIFSIVTPCFARIDDWEIHTYKDGSRFLRLKSQQQIKTRILSDSSGGKIISAKPHEFHKHIEVIEYFAGEHGTSQLVQIYHAALFDTARRKILGSFPVRYEAPGMEKQPAQPKWTSDENSIKIMVPDTGKTTEIRVKN